MTYNGWKNHATWNVALWLGNDEGLYYSTIEFMKNYDGLTPYRDFIQYCDLEKSLTPDGVHWLDSGLDYARLNMLIANRKVRS